MRVLLVSYRENKQGDTLNYLNAIRHSVYWGLSSWTIYP